MTPNILQNIRTDSSSSSMKWYLSDTGLPLFLSIPRFINLKLLYAPAPSENTLFVKYMCHENLNFYHAQKRKKKIRKVLSYVRNLESVENIFRFFEFFSILQLHSISGHYTILSKNWNHTNSIKHHIDLEKRFVVLLPPHKTIHTQIVEERERCRRVIFKYFFRKLTFVSSSVEITKKNNCCCLLWTKC